MKPVWEFSTQGIVWRLLPSPEGYFIGEDRDLTVKTVSFFCLDRTSGRVLWKGKQLNELWWVTLDAVHQDVVIIHGYAEPDMPEPRKIYVHDLHDGRELWSDESLRFLFAASDFLYAVREETTGPKFFRLGLRDGRLSEELQSEEVYSLKRSIHQEDDTTTIFPVPAGSGERPDFLIGEKNVRSRGISGIEIIDHGTMAVVGYYEKSAHSENDNGMVHHLAFYQGKKLLFDEVIDTDVRAVVPDSYFKISDMVYFIREKHILTGIRLTSEGEK